jgi:hypothetical protein
VIPDRASPTTRRHLRLLPAATDATRSVNGRDERPTGPWGSVGRLLGRLCHRMRMPGAIRSVVVDDEVTGQHLEVRVGSAFTVVSVDGRDYYFRRCSGRFDGTGLSG